MVDVVRLTGQGVGWVLFLLPLAYMEEEFSLKKNNFLCSHSILTHFIYPALECCKVKPGVCAGRHSAKSLLSPWFRSSGMALPSRREKASVPWKGMGTFRWKFTSENCKMWAEVYGESCSLSSMDTYRLGMLWSTWGGNVPYGLAPRDDQVQITPLLTAGGVWGEGFGGNSRGSSAVLWQ